MSKSSESMDKNTIWAIVLSAIVLFGSIFIETVFIVPKQQAKLEQQEIEKTAQEKALKKEQEEISSKITTINQQITTEAENSDSDILEKKYTISTNKAEIIFTNKGGDIVSYKLKNHIDSETGSGVEMVDNVTDFNRAFSLGFGDNSSTILNEIFNVKKIDEYTIGFSRTYKIKDEFGFDHSFIVGKLYTFKSDDYAFKLDITIKNLDSENFLDLNGYSYTIRTSPQIGPHFDKSNRYEVRQLVEFNGSKAIKRTFNNKDFVKEFTWAGVAGKYFTMLVMPQNVGTISNIIKCNNSEVNGYSNSQILLTRKALSSSNSTDSYYIYIGPRSEKELIKYNSSDKNEWSLVNVKFNQALDNSSFLYWIEVALKWAMEMIYKVVPNWGVAIIILTLILKIILFPLNKKNSVGTIKMQAIQPQMQVLQSKYKDNQQQLNIEMQKLYKEAGYNPASGCLPMILQMVVLFAMYRVFNNYFEFRGASFIHGWIDDLSIGDSILTWNKNIAIISRFTQNNLRLLPFIYTGSQLFNGVITQYGGTAGGNAQSQGSLKFMMYGMPILFFFMFYNVPSGLLLYWTTSNILQIGQQLIINQTMKKAKEDLKKTIKASNKNEIKFKGGKKKTR